MSGVACHWARPPARSARRRAGTNVRLGPAETVAVFGVGGLGHLALQYARIAGGFTIGADVFALHAAGRTRIVAVEHKLDEVNESIQEVLSGQVPARIVFRP